MLQREGLIEGEYNRRVRVVRLSILDLEELYALRIVEETVAIRLTVPHLTTVEFDEFDELLREMERLQKTDFEAWELVHQTFHARLVMHAGMQLSASLSRLVDHTGRYRKVLLEAAPMSYDIGAREHVAIIDACRARDAERSGQLLARHLARTALTLISLLRPEHDPVTVREAFRVVLGSEDSFPVPFEH
jgi:DNA-binding GntR family transcriptional regulator